MQRLYLQPRIDLIHNIRIRELPPLLTQLRRVRGYLALRLYEIRALLLAPLALCTSTSTSTLSRDSPSH